MDVRTRYTKSVIKEAFLSLLIDNTVSSVTVKEICAKADINRATFYKYYDNAYDLMDSLENELLNDLQERINALNKPVISDIFHVILQDILDKKQYYLTLFSQNGDKMFKERLFSLCYQMNMDTIRHYFPAMPNKKKEWLYYFLAEGCNGILNQWLQDGMKESCDEVVGFMQKLIDTINNSKL